MSDINPTHTPDEQASPGDTAPGGEHWQFGPFEVLEELGRGGMGVVFKAYQRHLDRTVALKMIMPGWLASPQLRLQFEREAVAGARVHHPNIAQVFEAGQIHGQSYISMECVEGGSLDELIGESKSPIEIAKLLLPVARAVQHLHDRGIVHCDLKPSNILLDADGQPKITDLGIADSSVRPQRS